MYFLRITVRIFSSSLLRLVMCLNICSVSPRIPSKVDIVVVRGLDNFEFLLILLLKLVELLFVANC